MVLPFIDIHHGDFWQPDTLIPVGGVRAIIFYHAMVTPRKKGRTVDHI